MVIYEVNLTVRGEIFDEYYVWLMGHVEKILEFKGFHQAEVAKEKLAEEGESQKLTVRYVLEKEEDLNEYLMDKALALREEAKQKFGDKFSATRRIFVQPSVKVNKNRHCCRVDGGEGKNSP